MSSSGAPPPSSTEYPPPLSAAEQQALSSAVKDWAAANGLVVRPAPSAIPADADPRGTAAVHVPVTLFPSPFPRECFEQGLRARAAYNELYAAVSRDEEFLERVVNEVGDGDEFIRDLWNIHLKVKQEGYTQPLSLGLFRSDYMVHQDETTRSLQAKQVEFNTIASSFGGLSQFTTGLHKFLAATEYPLLHNPPAPLDLPENETVSGLAAGIQAAYDAYGDPATGNPKCVIFLVQPGERNVFDQRHLEYRITASSPSPGTPVFRLPFTDVMARTTLADTPRRELLYRPPHGSPDRAFEVAVVYLRAGYGPADYPSAAAWHARHHIERSAAIKCPTVLTQLAGTKKVQQILATPQHDASQPSPLSRFIPDDDNGSGNASAQALRRTFTNIYPMDGTSPAGLWARETALDARRCGTYVLKPQREGGGNNVYRGAIPAFLRSVPEEHWGSYILMELIAPPPLSNVILRGGEVETGGVICELGVYGTCLWDQGTGEVRRNEGAGYLLRTKGDKSEEGGVAAGFGCMDSVALV